jgi:hypothetical protein
MLEISIKDKQYKLEYTFEAVRHKTLLKMMFDIMSGAYTTKKILAVQNENEANAVVAMLDGTSDMVADIPEITEIAFYAGLLENNPVDKAEAKSLMKQYMIDNKLSFNALYTDIKKCMEDDGFFDLSGINEMLEQMNKVMTEGQKNKKVVPMDHQKKKSTSKKS